jgi:ribosomal protein L11 methyltransferase
MNYIQLNCKINASDVTLVQEMLMHELAGYDYESFSETPDGLTAYIQAPLFNEDVLDQITFYQDLELGSVSFSWKNIEDQNWNEEWEKNFQPVNIAKRCYIRAPFHPEKPGVEFEIVMIPKMAFGTGHHETTSLMVETMLGIDFRDKKVLDMGCGTGVLAIMASKLGAADILAIDIDEWAYNSTIENSQMNYVNNITAKQGDIDLIDGCHFDIILANINRNILLAQIKHYAQSLPKGGILLMSGIYLDDIPLIKEEAEKYGFKHVSGLDKNKWTAVKFIK